MSPDELLRHIEAEHLDDEFDGLRFEPSVDARIMAAAMLLSEMHTSPALAKRLLDRFREELTDG